jgi:hypothetical protein
MFARLYEYTSAQMLAGSHSNEPLTSAKGSRFAYSPRYSGGTSSSLRERRSASPSTTRLGQKLSCHLVSPEAAQRLAAATTSPHNSGCCGVWARKSLNAGGRKISGSLRGRKFHVGWGGLIGIGSGAPALLSVLFVGSRRVSRWARFSRS